MSYVPPKRALVRYPIEEGAALQLQPAGVPVTPSPFWGGKHRVDGVPDLVAVFTCSIDHPLASAALLRCFEPKRCEDGETIVADLARNARRVVDETPLMDEPVDGTGRPYLWSEPHLDNRWIPPLPPKPGGFADAEEAVEYAAALLEQVEVADPSRLSTAMEQWRKQRDLVVADAKDRATRVRDQASDADRRRLDSLLHSIRRFLIEGPDVENDLEVDEVRGKQYLPTVGQAINHAAFRIAQLADQIEKAAADRTRKEQLREQIAMLVEEHFEKLPERIRLASSTGLLDDSMGAARAALLEILRPGWVFLDGEFEPPVNPPLEALEALEAARQDVPAAQLAYRPKIKERPGIYLLVSEFLGRQAVIELAPNETLAK